MRPIVMKFGGTSVADAAAIGRVVRIVARVAAESPVVVVVSAMSGTTDEFLRVCDLARRGELDEVERRIAAIRKRHEDTVDLVFRQRPEATEVSGSATSPGGFRLQAEDLRREMTRECDEALTVLRAVAVLRELTPRGTDRVTATGELMSSRILASALAMAGPSSTWVDARRVLVTDDAHPAALPLLENTRECATRDILPVLDRKNVAVLGGFVGATEGGITTTLGRGGSDLSASVIGAALHASEIQIWTDVDGMLTADPRVVDSAEVVPRLSFDEASELAYFGAKVLHPSTILPAVEDGIPVRILNTLKPEVAGSLITREAESGARPLTALACKRNITVVDVTSTRMLLAHGFLRRVFEVFEQHATSVDVVTTSEVSVSMTVDDDRRLRSIETDLQQFAEVRIEPAMAIVSAVGDSLRREPVLAVRLIAALEGIQLRMVSQAASRRNLTFVLADRDVPDAMNRLHQEFFIAAGTPR
jgi:aspartate kinase